jgi:transcriptional regulator with XRE-family HTH domain
VSSVIALHKIVQYIARMQALFSLAAYPRLMATKSNLRRLREATGLSVRELARQIGESPTNVSYWERSGQIPRSDVLAAMSKALAVTVEELLGEAKPKRVAAPAGKARQLFEAVSKLPRRQQQKILEVVEDMLVARGVNSQAKAA